LKKKSGITHFFLSLFLGGIVFIGCKKPGVTDGAQFLPEEDFLNAFQTDTFQINVHTTVEDEVYTDELSLAVVGYQADPILGETVCKTYTQFRLSALTPEFPEQMEIDSVVMSLAFNAAYYGTPMRQRFSVHPLAEDLVKDSTYNAQRVVAIQPTDLVKDGQEWVKVDTKNPAVVGGDTTVPQLRIPLDLELGQYLTHPSDPSVLDSQTAFLDYFKGVCIESRGRYDAVMRYDLIDPTTKITIYYRDLSGSTPDTLLYDFVVNTDCARYNYFEHRYQNTALANVKEAPVDGDEYFYIQSGGGLKAIIDLPTLMNLKEGNKVINKAELIVPIDFDAAYTQFEVLYLRYENEEGELKILPDEVSQSISGNYNSSSRRYKFNITRYVQSLMTGEIDSSPLHLIGGTSGVSVKRAVAHGPKFNPANPSENTRLIVTFAE
jgi:hypothetical protein